MHKHMKLAVHFNKVSDGTEPGMVVNQVHKLLADHLAHHGFVGVQVIHHGHPEPEQPVAASAEQPAEVEETAEEKPSKKKSK